MEAKREQPILFIAGLGRCGTTMVMTMLDAGGFPVAGPAPAYEPAQHWHQGKPEPDWISAQGGHAVKWIDPTRCPKMRNLLPGPSVILLMERDPAEQAKSQIKMIGPIAERLGRRGRKAMERSIIRDMPIARTIARKTGLTRRYRFEDFIANPIFAARALERLVTTHFDIDFDGGRAARSIISRNAKCLPDLTMEKSILPSLAHEIASTRPAAQENAPC